MATATLQLRNFNENQTWFVDREQLPGWRIEWQMGRNAEGQVVVSSLRIKPAHDKKLDRILKRSKRNSDEWFAALRAVMMPVIPGAGITSRLLRRVRLGEPARSGKEAIATDRWPAGDRKRRRRGAPETIKITWWRQLNNRYCELRAEGRRDYAKVLAKEFFGSSNARARARMRSRISRGILSGHIDGEYQPPPSATRVQREPE